MLSLRPTLTSALLCSAVLFSCPCQMSILGNQKTLDEIVQNQQTILAHVAKN